MQEKIHPDSIFGIKSEARENLISSAPVNRTENWLAMNFQILNSEFISFFRG